MSRTKLFIYRHLNIIWQKFHSLQFLSQILYLRPHYSFTVHSSIIWSRVLEYSKNSLIRPKLLVYYHSICLCCASLTSPYLALLLSRSIVISLKYIFRSNARHQAKLSSSFTGQLGNQSMTFCSSSKP